MRRGDLRTRQVTLLASPKLAINIDDAAAAESVVTSVTTKVMMKRLALSIALAAALAFSPPAHAQDQGEQDKGGRTSRASPERSTTSTKKEKKPAPAPKHDISGVWEPAGGPGAGIHANGAGQMPSDGKPEHELPFTPLGRQTFMAHKPTFGVTQVPSALTNDPMPGCNRGIPRVVLHNFRTSRVIQTPENVVILYEFNKKWRVIWTDGRQLPKDAESPTWGFPDAPESRWWAIGGQVDRRLHLRR